ncbi:MAG: ATPase, T2SS/T4P/T4SS family, partial [Eubacteriales bacterium]|nr:ATPase, T2SS/T4P/T4SS family [Eubacteriales bacterium]
MEKERKDIRERKDFQELSRRLMLQLDTSRELEDAEIYVLIDRLLMDRERGVRYGLRRREELRQELFNSVRKLDILQELIDDDTITEVMVNGMDGIFIERSGQVLSWDKRFYSREKIEDLVQSIAAKSNRIVNATVPIADARLENGARVNIVLPPVAINGPIITIRQFPTHPITMSQLIAWGAVSSEAAEFLRKLVIAGYNIFISGGTGSGKTTFLNALSDYIPKDERIITIEDNAELQIRGVANLVRLEARKENTQGEHAITIRDLIRSSLRMRPDRVIVGEVRGEETIDMIQ